MISKKKFGFSLASILTLIFGSIAVALFANKLASVPRIYLVPAAGALIVYGMAAIVCASALLSFVALIRKESETWSIVAVAFWAFPVIYLSTTQIWG